MTAADKPWNQPIVEEMEEIPAEAPNPPGYDNADAPRESFACVFSKPYWGENDEHGVELIAAYLESLGRKMQRPDYVILVHDAVALAANDHKAFGALRQLGDTGTSVLVLQESINEDKTVDLGTMTSMDEIVSVMIKVEKVMMF